MRNPRLNRRRAALLILSALSIAVASDLHAEDQPGILKREFIYEKASFPQCHASTIAETPGGLVAAWFGGRHEKNPEVGIWVSRFDGKRW